MKGRRPQDRDKGKWGCMKPHVPQPGGESPASPWGLKGPLALSLLTPRSFSCPRSRASSQVASA